LNNKNNSQNIYTTMSSYSIDKSPMKSEILSIENRNRAATDFNLSVKINSSSHDPNAPDQDFEDQENLGKIYNKDKSSSVMSRPQALNDHGAMEVQIFFLKQGGRGARDTGKISGMEPA
jgi:hypothetical protein